MPLLHLRYQAIVTWRRLRARWAATAFGGGLLLAVAGLNYGLMRDGGAGLAPQVSATMFSLIFATETLRFTSLTTCVSRSQGCRLGMSVPQRALLTLIQNALAPAGLMVAILLLYPEVALAQETSPWRLAAVPLLWTALLSALLCGRVLGAVALRAKSGRLPTAILAVSPLAIVGTATWRSAGAAANLAPHLLPDSGWSLLTAVCSAVASWIALVLVFRKDQRTEASQSLPPRRRLTTPAAPTSALRRHPLLWATAMELRMLFRFRKTGIAAIASIACAIFVVSVYEVNNDAGFLEILGLLILLLMFWTPFLANMYGINASAMARFALVDEIGRQRIFTAKVMANGSIVFTLLFVQMGIVVLLPGGDLSAVDTIVLLFITGSTAALLLACAAGCSAFLPKAPNLHEYSDLYCDAVAASVASVAWAVFSLISVAVFAIVLFAAPAGLHIVMLCASFAASFAICLISTRWLGRSDTLRDSLTAIGLSGETGSQASN